MRYALITLFLFSSAVQMAWGGEAADAAGQALPPMAKARLGSIRLWQGTYVRALAFALDDDVLVSGGGVALNSPSLLLWQCESGMRVGSLPSSGISTMGMCSSPDGRYLGVSTNRSQIWIFDLKTKKKVASHKGRGSVVGMDFTPDSKKLLFTNYNQTGVLDVTTGKATTWKLPGYSVSIHPDGKKFALCSTAYGRGKTKQGYVLIRDLETGKALDEIKPPGKHKYYWPSYSHDGKKLVVSMRGSGPNDIAIFDAETLKQIRAFRAHGSRANMLEASPTEDVFASCGYDNKICLYDLDTGKKLHTMPFDSGGAANLTFSRDGRRIAAGSRHGAIEIWDVKTGKPTLQRQGHRTRLQASAISRDGRYAVTCDIDEKIIAWSFPEGRKIGQVTARDLHPRALMFDASGDRIHALGAKGICRTYALPSLKQVGQANLGGGVMDVYRPAGEEDVHVLLREGQVVTWDISKPKPSDRTRLGKVDNTRAGALSPDLRYAVLVQSAGLWLYSLPSRNGHFIQHSGMYTYGGGSPVDLPGPSDVLAASSGNGVVIYEVDSGQVVHRISDAAKSVVTSLTFSSDGRFLAVGGNEGGIGIYSMIHGKQVARLKGHSDPQRKNRSRLSRRHGILPGTVMTLTFSQDGRYLLSAGNDTTGIVWDVSKITSQPLMAAEPGRLEDFWSQLASSNADAAHRARWAMASMGDEATAFLEERLAPAEAADRSAIQKLIRGLNAPRFAQRTQAYRELLKIGREALPVLRRTLESNPPAEVRTRSLKLIEALDRAVIQSAGMLRLTRSVRLLERIGSQRAKALLEDLAGGDEGSRMTLEAQAALIRLQQQSQG